MMEHSDSKDNGEAVEGLIVVRVMIKELME